MSARRIAAIAAVAAVATARAILAFAAALVFWAAAPAMWGWQPTSVMTASMSPAIEVGDVVVARPVPTDQLVAGRVVLADDPDWPDRLRLHRVHEVAADGTLRTKGDANPVVDSSPLHPGAVHGVGVLRVPWVGLPVVWARTGDAVPLAITLILLGASAVLAARRGSDDTDGEGPDDHRERAALTDPTTRRARRALGLAAVAAVVVAGSATPAWAALSDRSAGSAAITAARVTPPFSLGCRWGDTSVTWQYTGVAARSFEIVVDGAVAVSGIPPESRSARLPTTRGYWPFERSTVQIRAVVSDRWSADSTESVRIGGGFLGFGAPVCR